MKKNFQQFLLVVFIVFALLSAADCDDDDSRSNTGGPGDADAEASGADPDPAGTATGGDPDDDPVAGPDGDASGSPADGESGTAADGDGDGAPPADGEDEPPADGEAPSAGDRDPDADGGAEADEEHPPYEDDMAEIVKGPYLQKVTETEIAVAWESDHYSSSRLEITAPDGGVVVFKGETYKIIGDFWLDLIPAPSPDGWQHLVTATGLTEGRAYSYRILSLKKPVGPYTVKTAKAGQPFVIAAYGDSRSHPEIHLQVAEAVRDEAPTLLFHSGDFVHRGNKLDDWQSFFDVLALYSPDTIIVPAFGNHEGGGMSLFLGYFKSFFPNDGVTPAGATEYRYGDLWILVLNSELRFQAEGMIHTFMEEKLQAAEADESILYRFVMFHKPYMTWSGHEPEDWFRAVTKEELHVLMRDHRVTAVITGHNHCYEHFERDGVVYLTLGGAGAGLADVEINIVPGEEEYHVKSFKGYSYAIIKPDDGDLTVRAMDVETETEIESFIIPAR